MKAQPLKILLVSPQRTTLRHLSKLLQVFGYQVLQAASFEQGLAALSGQRPNLLVVDDEPDFAGAIDFCRRAAAQGGGQPLFTLLVVRDALSAAELVQAVEAGVDDFLGKPVEHGELLARLRVGARMLEHERRSTQQGARDPGTGLLPRAAFEAALRREVQRAREKPLALVAVDLDFTKQLQDQRGRAAADAMVREVGAMVARACQDCEPAGRLDYDQFVVLLTNTSQAEAAAWAERLRAVVAEAEFEGGVRATISCGVAGRSDARESAEDLLAHAEQALQLAKLSGRDCVVRHREFQPEEARWAELAAPGKLFERTVARDVMTPCTVILRQTDPLGLAAAWLRQTSLRAAPVVDDEGKLSGLVTTRSVLSAAERLDRAADPVADLMSTDVVSVDEQTTLSALMDCFQNELPMAIVIVCKGRPCGLVTPSGLATLGEQLTTATFATGSTQSPQSGCVVVPNLVLAEAED
ncbi:MAG: diguanylate cyclase [Pirellulales bacterium]